MPPEAGSLPRSALAGRGSSPCLRTPLRTRSSFFDIITRKRLVAAVAANVSANALLEAHGVLDVHDHTLRAHAACQSDGEREEIGPV
jgi:hypothetical protein